jgi:hypothetical protein
MKKVNLQHLAFFIDHYEGRLLDPSLPFFIRKDFQNALQSFKAQYYQLLSLTIIIH